MDDIFAHSLPGAPFDRWERYGVHAAAVAALAAEFAAPFGFAEAGRLAGLLHDVGKLSPQFQAYIRDEAASGGDHSSAGARIAVDTYGKPFGTILAAIIAAHHAGLADGVDLETRMEGAARLVPPGWQAATGPLPALAALAETRPFDLRAGPKGFAKSFFVRMLFSCLVDADFLATERFYTGADGVSAERGNHASIEELRDRLAAHMARLAARAAAEAPTPLNALRAEILRHALAKAGLPPGPFTLTVPTGGGKTLASLAFALEHAVRHGLRRVIFVVPYASIIEQTAEVYRRALGDHDVLEHHASFDWERARGKRREDDEYPRALDKLQRAAENWDVPVVVTTAVQFFESLFSNQPSRCRKLHNIVDSVVVLDEVQTLPVGLLRPAMAALDELARNYRTSIVLCTATQPALRRIDGAIVARDGQPVGFDIDDARELAPDPAGLYQALRRVRVERLAEPIGDDVIAARFAEMPQIACIVDTRHHARALFEAIRSLPGAVHLSTLMCPRHRRMVLATLRGRLVRGEPVRLVATPLIEAGVDIDFPEVWRAAAGIDSIAQAAGRANREGRLVDADGRPRLGRVVVFEPALGEGRRGLQQDTKVRWEAARGPLLRYADPLGLDAVRDYFIDLYLHKKSEALDAAVVDGRPGILAAIEARNSALTFPFKSIAEAFRMIDETMEPVIVPWRADPADDEASELLDRIAVQPSPATADLRRLQQYTVPVPPRMRGEWLARGVLRPVHPALGEVMLRFADMEHYDPATGVVLSLEREAGSNVIG